MEKCEELRTELEGKLPGWKARFEIISVGYMGSWSAVNEWY